MTINETSPNPYQATSAEPEQAKSSTKTLKYISHGVYLQLFLGAGSLALSAFDIEIGPRACGALLIGLGLNSLIYIHRYKRSLR